MTSSGIPVNQPSLFVPCSTSTTVKPYVDPISESHSEDLSLSIPLSLRSIASSTSTSVNTSHMQTRSKSRISKPKKMLSLSSNFHDTELSCLSQAVKNHKWQQAMANEFNALLTN